MNGNFLARAALALLATAAALDAGAQADNRLVVPLSDPARPAKLDVNLVFGSITVSAYNGNEVVVVAKEDLDDDEDGEDDNNFRERERERELERERERDEDGATDPRAGLRKISSTSFDLAVSERDNIVTIRMAGPPRSLSLEVSVPRRTSVRAVTINDGILTVNGVVGEHELQNHNGDVFATDIGGSAVISTQNGEVRASFSELTPGKAMSFSSFNGDVDVAFPANFAAELQVNSGRGDLYTDFDVVAQPQAPVVESGGEPGRREIRMKREFRARVGAGGPTMQFRTFNGDVMIRKR
jgi:putative adhesin